MEDVSLAIIYLSRCCGQNKKNVQRANYDYFKLYFFINKIK